MNTILQKRIDEAAREVSDVCEPCDYGDPFCASCHRPYMYDAAKKIGEVILNNLWISVDEALPTERDDEDEQYSTNVFARTKDCIRYAYYDFYNESWCPVEGGYRFGDVTHWMPIPSLEGGK